MRQPREEEGHVRKLLLVLSVVLLLGICTGTALQADGGKPVARPAGVGLTVDGTNYATPPPSDRSVADLVSIAAALVVGLVLLAGPRWLRSRRDDGPTLHSTVVVPVVARRGPPLPA